MSERQEMFTNYPDVVCTEELQKMLGISKSKAYELLQNKEIKSRKIGTIYKIPKINIIEYLQGD